MPLLNLPSIKSLLVERKDDARPWYMYVVFWLRYTTVIPLIGLVRLSLIITVAVVVVYYSIVLSVNLSQKRKGPPGNAIIGNKKENTCSDNVDGYCCRHI